MKPQSLPHEPEEKSPHSPVSSQVLNRWQRGTAHHPYFFVVLLLALFTLAEVGIPFVVSSLGMSEQLSPFGRQLFAMLLAVLLLSALHWWRETGFARLSTLQDIKLYIVPIALLTLIALPLAQNIAAGWTNIPAMRIVEIA